MNVIFDTNVVMDVLTSREPFADASTEAMALAGDRGWNIAVTANTVTDLYFLLRKHFTNNMQAKNMLLALVERINVLDTTREICLRAFKSPVADFEEAVLTESALLWLTDCIVTRNTRDFANSPVEAMAPDDFLQRFGG